MSFRRALLGVCLVLRCTRRRRWPSKRARSRSATRSPSPGFAGFRIDFSGALRRRQLRRREPHLQGRHDASAVTMHYDGRNRAWGGFSPQGAQPDRRLAVDRGRRQAAHLARAVWRRRHGAGDSTTRNGSPRRSRRSPTTSASARSIRCRRRSSSASAGDAACDRTVPSNDGKRRIDVILTQDRHRAGRDRRRAAGARATCWSARSTPSASPANSTTRPRKPRPSASGRCRIWLARLDDTPFRYPVKLEASTGFGTIRGRLLSFRERPLTAAGKRGDAGR